MRIAPSFLAIVLLLAPIAASAFTDVRPYDPNAYYEGENHATAIDALYADAIVKGYADGTFRPDDYINRAEFLTILLRTQDGDESSCTGGSFSDIGGNAWFAATLCRAKRDGVVSGYADGTFHPQKFINLAEAAKIIVRAMNVPPSPACGGKACADPWFRADIEALAAANALPGDIRGVSQLVTRGQMAEIVYRLQHDVTDQYSPAYADLEVVSRAANADCPVRYEIRPDQVSITRVDVENGVQERVLDDFERSLPALQGNAYTLRVFAQPSCKAVILTSYLPETDSVAGDLYRFRPENGKIELMQVNDDFNRRGGEGAFSPDGRFLVFPVAGDNDVGLDQSLMVIDLLEDNSRIVAELHGDETLNGGQSGTFFAVNTLEWIGPGTIRYGVYNQSRKSEATGMWDSMPPQLRTVTIGTVKDDPSSGSPVGDGGVTLVVQGMTPENVGAFLGAAGYGDGLSDRYLEDALVAGLVPGVPVPDGESLRPGRSESLYRISWTRHPDLKDTLTGIEQMKTALKLAAERGKKPINIVAHSWGSVIAYIALTELAKEGASIHVDNFFTMGSPLWLFKGTPRRALNAHMKSKPTHALDGIKEQVPAAYRNKPVSKPAIVGTWTNYWLAADLVGNQPLVGAGIDNAPSVGTVLDCPAVYTCHSLYFSDPASSPTIAEIKDMIQASYDAGGKPAQPAARPSATSSSSRSSTASSSSSTASSAASVPDKQAGALPTVMTNTATITSSNTIEVTLNGYVNQNGSTNTVRWFEWGTTTEFTRSTPHRTMSPYNGGTDPTFSEWFVTNIDNSFKSSTTYYYRAVAQSEQGKIVYGDVVSFTTPEK